MSNVKHYLIAFLAFFMGLVSDVANLLQMMSLDNGWWWLLGLFLVAVGYMVSQQVWGGWQRWRTFQDKFEKIGDLLGSLRYCGVKDWTNFKNWSNLGISKLNLFILFGLPKSIWASLRSILPRS